MSFTRNVIVIQQSQEMLEVLQKHRYKVLEASDCIDGIRKIIRFRPNLVVAEISMPALNGFSMAKILSKLEIDIPIILTSFIEKHQKQAATHHNVVGFMVNPSPQTGFDKKAFVAQIDTIFRELKGRERGSSEHVYRFRQHEWANLIGLSVKKRVLLVEDDEVFRTLTLTKLDAVNRFNLFTSNDGIEGVFKALLVEPDLILTDIMMPNLDGMAMSQLFYILNKPFPIVFLSAKDDAETQKKVQKAVGILGFMNKSLIKNTDEFLKQIDTYLDQAAKMAQSRKKVYQEATADNMKDIEEGKSEFL